MHMGVNIDHHEDLVNIATVHTTLYKQYCNSNIQQAEWEIVVLFTRLMYFTQVYDVALLHINCNIQDHGNFSCYIQ